MLLYKSIDFNISSLSYGNKGILMMKKILMMSAVLAAITSTNVDAMSGYGMPSYGMQSPQGGYGQGAYGMSSPQGGYGQSAGQSAYGMQSPQNGYGQPAMPTPAQGGVNPLTQDVKNSILQNVMNNPNLSQDIKGEAAFAMALKVSLNEAIICLTFGQNGQIFRLHSNSKNNGLVSDPGEIQNYNNMLAQAKNGNGTATVQSSVISNGQPETFTFDVLAIDANRLVIVRHK
jgi:hypothetical protein